MSLRNRGWMFAGPCLALALLLSGVAMGDWAYLSPEEMAEQSDLIVLGECIGLERVASASDGSTRNIGVLRVDRVLRGQAPTPTVRLLLPPDRPHGLVASADVSVVKGQRGLWYLRGRGGQLYFIDRPDRFVAMDEAQPRIDALRKREP
jgi:hypothetical protein